MRVGIGVALEESRSGRESSTRLCTAGRGLELAGHVLVRRESRVRSMPGAAVGIDRGICGGRELAVRAPPLVRRRRPVDGRPKKWMVERDARPDLDQVGLLCRSSRLGGNAKSRSRPPEKHWIAERLGSTDEQQPLRFLGQPADPASEARLDPARERQRIRQRKPAGEAC